jgi:putative tricarboxylic transport membrane protein
MVIDPQSQMTDAAETSPEITGWQRWAEMLVAVTVIILGIVILIETQDIRVTRAMARVSPRAIPQIVGVGLVALGIWYALDVYRTPHAASGGEDSEDVDPQATTDWTVIAVIAVGLALFALLISEAGFVLASAALFAVSAFAMGSRRVLADLAIGIVLGTAIFLLFDSWLGVRLPEGWLGGVLP